MKWRKVDKVLPEIENELYNVYCHDDKEGLVHSLIFENGKFGEEGGCEKLTPYVTHWMPLPPPPEDV